MGRARQGRARARGGTPWGWLGLCALLAWACGPGPLSSGQGTLALGPTDPTALGELPEFELVERSGRTITRADVVGAPALFAFFFTRCAGPCPALTGQMRRAQEELEGTRARLVSVSVDPGYDTPERLAAYAQSFTADPERWWFLTGEEDAIYSLMREGFALAVERGELPEHDDVMGMQVTHATRLVAIDAQGRIRGYYDGESDAGRAGAVARLQAFSGGPLRSRSVLPRLNATLNGCATLLLAGGLVAVLRGRRRLHGWLMGGAFAVSAVFLASYLYYHLVVIPAQGGPVGYRGQGGLRVLYLSILATHVVLAVVNLPLVLRLLYLAGRQRWASHRRLGWVVWPIWMYVSVTGVVVYLMLYPWNPPPG